ncbi:MAG: hypothetical protein FWE25_11355 [Lachnospiraceae bacterium]|nr:hypothetical protein [Lachnospiraceae bacterium]
MDYFKTAGSIGSFFVTRKTFFFLVRPARANADGEMQNKKLTELHKKRTALHGFSPRPKKMIYIG